MHTTKYTKAILSQKQLQTEIQHKLLCVFYRRMLQILQQEEARS